MTLSVNRDKKKRRRRITER